MLICNQFILKKNLIKELFILHSQKRLIWAILVNVKFLILILKNKEKLVCFSSNWTIQSLCNNNWSNSSNNTKKRCYKKCSHKKANVCRKFGLMGLVEIGKKKNYQT